MPGFAIEFAGEAFTDEDGRWRRVVLTLGDCLEGNYADLSHWSPIDYEHQWRSELMAISTERDRGALIVSLHDPSYGDRVISWTMWRQGGDVLLHNQILFMLQDCPDFDPSRVYEHVGAYESHSEDGVEISEWSVPLQAIREFIGNGV